MQQHTLVCPEPEAADALFEAGHARHREGQLDEAGRLYGRALAADPAHGPTLHMAGMLAVGEGDAALGMARLERALAVGYRTATVLEHYAVVQLRHGAVAPAVAHLREAAMLDPHSGSIWFNLGVGERQAGRAADAAAAFGRAAPLLRAAYAEHALGLALQESGQGAAAAAAYGRALALDPGCADAALNAGVIAQQAGDLADAMALYRQALAASPGLIAARANLAAALHEAGEDADAAAMFRAILAEDPGALPALNGLGAVLRTMGDDAGALTLFERALALDPFHPVASLNQTELLFDGGRDAEAVACCRARADAHPAEARAWLELGRVLARAGAHAEEARALSQAVACDPDGAQAHHRLGNNAQRRQDWAGAAVHYRDAARLAPDRTEPWLGLALAGLKSGDGAAALAACEAVLARNRFDQSGLAYRALALRLLGQDCAADWLTDLHRLVTVLDLRLDLPDLGALAEALRAVRNRAFAPAGQSIRGGTQTQNELLAERAPPIQAVRAALDRQLGAYLAARPRDPAHPFLANPPKRLRYQSWSVILGAQGHHVPHIHPTGCISGVLYVAVPPPDGVADAGCLELGRPGIETPLRSAPPIRLVQPVPGMLVLFPSYMWHGTRPFTGPGERITIAFDVVGDAPKTRDNWW